MSKFLLAIASLGLVGSSALAGDLAANLVRSPAQCSRAGDQTARPVLKKVGGKLVLVGYECVQDNRGSNGG